MLMPKTSMDKNDFLPRPKDKIWFPGEILLMKPVAVSKPVH